LDRQVSRLRQRLKSVEQQAASEAVAREHQAKLAETMTRAARAEARQREALMQANAELAGLLQSMEDELAALKAEHTATPEQAPNTEASVLFPDDITPPVRKRDATPSPIKRMSIRMPRLAVAGLCLAVLVVGAILYAAVTAFVDDGAGTLMGRATVINGATIYVDGETVRLLDIDAPPAGTLAGKRATDYLRQLAAGQDVRCETDGRRVGDDVPARCFIGAVDISQVMMLSGNAVAPKTVPGAR
jgi:endonuclease YncB( thermonuclease family)